MAVATEILHQAGAIAYRIHRGRVEVLLLTSRDSGRWIIPKGNIAAGLAPARAAVREAYQEGGVRGRVDSAIPLGFYTYFKRLDSGESRPTAVEVYLLRVETWLRKWPERHERQLAWLPPAAAARLVEEPGVVPLLRRLMEFADDLARPRPAAGGRRRQTGKRRTGKGP